MFDRADAIDQAFVRHVKSGSFPVLYQSQHMATDYPPDHILLDLFETQLMSRHLDLMARRSKGKSFYSIGSSGHEGMAALGTTSRTTDMAFLHYRDAAFLIQRLKQGDASTPLYDMALSFCANKNDPVSGGRHKVLGSANLFVPPQTSTIASHLPKAVGAAHSISLAAKIKKIKTPLPRDSVIIASFGDASANHSTAQGALNTAAWTAYQGLPMPIVFICEDNNIGISVETPTGWIQNSFQNRPGLTYFSSNGLDIVDTMRVTCEAIRFTRTQRKPAFLHMRTVRLMGHAGADIEASYTPLAQIERNEALDPLLQTAQILLQKNILSSDDIIHLYETMRARVKRVSEIAMAGPKLETATEVMKSLIPPKSGKKSPTLKSPSQQQTNAPKNKEHKSLPLSRHINMALKELLEQYPQLILFGEDVGRKGGVYGVSSGLQQKFGTAKVFDTLLDEQSILGLAIGAAHNGFIPIPEIQFLAYLHNAEDQIRGEAATLPFFSNGHYANPMVIRIAGLGYQKGFGGHFHNDNSLAVLRDIPGIIVACPSNGQDGARMLREAVRLAYEENRVVIFIEPIALYNMTDLHEPGDELWTAPYAGQNMDEPITLGDIHIHNPQDNNDLAIITYGNGYFLSRQAEKILKEKHKIDTRIIDLRWLSPLPADAICNAVKPCRNILIVDECRESGAPSEAIITLLQQNKITQPTERLTAKDSFIPLGPAAYSTLPSTGKIVEQSLAMCKKNKKRTRKNAS